MTDQLSGQGERPGPGPIPGAQPTRSAYVPGRLGSPELVRQGLRDVGYLPNERIASVVYLGEQLAKPVLVEGPAGTGKTELAKSVALMAGMRLIRLQCYEGLDEAKALYEWNYKKQLLSIQAVRRQAAAAQGAGLVGRGVGHLQRGIPAVAPAARGDPVAGARRPAHRRGGPA